MQAILIIIAILVILVVIYKIYIRKRVMTPGQFIEAARQRIISDHPNVSIISIFGFNWTLEIEGKQNNIYFDNTYALYCRFPDQFNDIIDHFIRAMSNPEDVEILSWDDAKHRLLPSLKSQYYIEDLRYMPGGATVADNLVVCDYNYGLKILIAIDSEMSISFATTKQLENWGVSKDELLRISIDNLSKLTAQLWVEATLRAQKSGVFAFATYDGYDASRILLPDFYERASRALGSNELLVGIPNRDFICAIPKNAPWKDKFCKQIQSDAQSCDHPITPDPITLP